MDIPGRAGQQVHLQTGDTVVTMVDNKGRHSQLFNHFKRLVIHGAQRQLVMTEKGIAMDSVWGMEVKVKTATITLEYEGITTAFPLLGAKLLLRKSRRSI